MPVSAKTHVENLRRIDQATLNDLCAQVDTQINASRLEKVCVDFMSFPSSGDYKARLAFLYEEAGWTCRWAYSGVSGTTSLVLEPFSESPSSSECSPCS